MNIFEFIGLLKTIHGTKKPDLSSIQKKGLLAVKIAQHYALRVDFLNPEVCQELAKLFRATDSLPPKAVKTLISKNCPTNWLGHFKSFDENAFASASIGQVHKGVLNDGTEVVVKLIKQNNRLEFLDDLKRIKSFFRFILWIYPKLKRVFNPLEALEYIENYTLSELNLQNEINGRETLESIQNEYGNLYDLSRLRFPDYFPDISNDSVLVSELVQGSTFDELLDEGKLDYELLLDFFKIHGFYLFAIGSFHGDIHPGNIILDQNDKIVLIDNGAISTVRPLTRQGLFNFFEVLSQYEYEEAAHFLHAMSVNKIPGSAYKAFEKKFIRLYKDFTNSTVSDVSLTRKMMETIKLGVHSGMTFGDDMFGIIKGLMYLDGMVLRCNPQANLMQDIRQFTTPLKEVLDEVETRQSHHSK